LLLELARFVQTVQANDDERDADEHASRLREQRESSRELFAEHNEQDGEDALTGGVPKAPQTSKTCSCNVASPERERCKRGEVVRPCECVQEPGGKACPASSRDRGDTSSRLQVSEVSKLRCAAY